MFSLYGTKEDFRLHSGNKQFGSLLEIIFQLLTYMSLNFSVGHPKEIQVQMKNFYSSQSVHNIYSLMHNLLYHFDSVGTCLKK